MVYYIAFSRLLATMPKLGDPSGQKLWIVLAVLAAAAVLIAAMLALGERKRK